MLTFRGPRSELVARLRELAAALAGHAPDPHGVVAPVLTRGAIALLSQIQTAFLAKARGGVGSDGIKWAPLKRATIAARPIARGEKKALGVGGKRVRGLLTPAEDKRWRKIFGQKMAQLRARGLDGPEAMGIAARVAWAALKAAGAKTRLEVLGGRTVEILRDTGALLQSLTPGYEETPSGAEDQVLDVRPGRITVGTKVPYAIAHHRGNPAKKLPARPLWPETLPESWQEAVNAALLRGILRAVNQIVAAGG
jgi:hypothetical protein